MQLGQEMGSQTSTSTPGSSPLLTASHGATSFATNPLCSFVLREAGLPLQCNNQNQTQGVQSTNHVAREGAVPQGQDKGSFR